MRSFEVSPRLHTHYTAIVIRLLSNRYNLLFLVLSAFVLLLHAQQRHTAQDLQQVMLALQTVRSPSNPHLFAFQKSCYRSAVFADLPQNDALPAILQHKTVAQSLFEQVKVFCWIMTSPMSKKKAQAVKNTWARRCNGYVFISSVNDESLPAIDAHVKEGRKRLWGKTKFGFRWVALLKCASNTRLNFSLLQPCVFNGTWQIRLVSQGRRRYLRCVRKSASHVIELFERRHSLFRMPP